MQRFLAVDIGNTNITFGLFEKKRLIKTFSISTLLSHSKTEQILKGRLQSAKSITCIIICSVVPEVLPFLNKQLKKICKVKPKIAGKDIKVPIKNLYKKPEAVGRDRLVNAYTVKSIYGAPAIIIDFGTAITFDYLNKKGQYEGGIIAPGVEISLEALFNKTSLLPKVKIKPPKSLIGKSTVESIRSGAIYGLSCMCDGIINMLKIKYGPKIKVIATGGLSSLFAKYTKKIDLIDKHLTLKGLRLLI